MARDYKNSATRKKKKKAQVPGWVWLLTGLMVGLLVALLVYLNGQKDKPRQKTVAGKQVSKKATKSNKKLRYEFYTILPESEVVIPDHELPSGNKPAKSANPGNFMLQAGSFRQKNDAERRKANLALLGIVANIQVVTVNGDTWHRVRIGPFKTLSAIRETRRLLRENKINAIFVRNR